MTITNLVETHCHILPGIDDGAPDVETSIQMIRKLKSQGAKAIILTPHY
ncbi:MAG: capsular biosynthesis protein, partial [Eubacterium sp.]|nr:capsular biosynthesis protein [Eubacterium sp.]